MNKVDLSDVIWRKSSRSDGQNNCVEIAMLPQRSVGIRDSKDKNGPVLIFTPNQWENFIDSVKFDALDIDLSHDAGGNDIHPGSVPHGAA